MAAQPAWDMQVQQLYEQMKCSHGGVMLLVRLRADMRSLGEAQLTKFLDTLPSAGFDGHFEEGSRLAVTYKWLDKQFGPVNAARAVAETAQDLLDSD